MIYNATNLISETFDQRGVKYRIIELEGASDIEAAFKVSGGPIVAVRFISNSERNDVAVRVFGLINEITAEKRVVMLEVCNQLMKEIRFCKFCLDDKNDLNLEYDFPVNLSDESVGECCFEMFARIMNILDQKYRVLAEALYAGKAENKMRDLYEALKVLKGMQTDPIVIPDK